MENQENTQSQSSPAPAVTGPNVTELQAKIAELEKAREGLIRDVQSERTKRQELETRVASPVPPTENQGVTDDELGKVLKPYIEPALREIAQLKAQTADEKALNYLSSKTGKNKDQVLEDRNLQERLMGIARKWRLVGDSYDVAQRAYELMELEDLRNKEVERSRAVSAAQSQSMPSGTGVVNSVSSKKYSAEEFNNMNPREFGILAKSGDFRKLPDGTFDYIPR